MKKKILLVAAVVMCLAIATAGTLAYFTSEDTAHNVITSGDVNIELVEQTKKEDGTLVEFPELLPAKSSRLKTPATTTPGCA